MSPIAPEPILFLMGAASFALAAVVGRSRTGATGFARIARAPRLGAIGAGLLCVIAGVILLGSEDYSSTATAVTIAIELDGEDVSEEVRVFLEGRDVGVLRVDRQSPKGVLTTTVARTGRHDYRLESTQHERGRRPQRVSHKSQVVIAGKGRLLVTYGPDGQVYLLALR